MYSREKERAEKFYQQLNTDNATLDENTFYITLSNYALFGEEGRKEFFKKLSAFPLRSKNFTAINKFKNLEDGSLKAIGITRKDLDNFISQFMKLFVPKKALPPIPPLLQVSSAESMQGDRDATFSSRDKKQEKTVSTQAQKTTSSLGRKDCVMFKGQAFLYTGSTLRPDIAATIAVSIKGDSVDGKGQALSLFSLLQKDELERDEPRNLLNLITNIFYLKTGEQVKFFIALKVNNFTSEQYNRLRIFVEKYSSHFMERHLLKACPIFLDCIERIVKGEEVAKLPFLTANNTNERSTAKAASSNDWHRSP